MEFAVGGVGFERVCYVVVVGGGRGGGFCVGELVGGLVRAGVSSEIGEFWRGLVSRGFGGGG